MKFGGNPDFQLPESSGTMVGFSKSFPDLVNANFINTSKLVLSQKQIADTLDSVHYYNQIFVLEKSYGNVRLPVTRHKFGKKIPYYSEPPYDPPEPLSIDLLKDHLESAGEMH